MCDAIPKQRVLFQNQDAGFLQNAFLEWTCTCVWVAQLSESFCHFRGVNVKLEFLRSIYAGNTEDARGRPATD